MGEELFGMVEGSREPVRYAITDLAAKSASGLDAAEDRRMRLAAAVTHWSGEGFDYIQMREKSLDAGEIFALAHEGMRLLRKHEQQSGSRPRLLVNGRPDLAAAARADGVHLTGRPGELTPAQAREVFRAAGLNSCLISVSCHGVQEVIAARDGGADMILFGPVFGKTVAGEQVSKALGLRALEQAAAAAAGVPVLALGGVSAENTGACLRAGAAGVAAIRLFALACS